MRKSLVPGTSQVQAKPISSNRTAEPIPMNTAFTKRSGRLTSSFGESDEEDTDDEA